MHCRIVAVAFLVGAMQASADSAKAILDASEVKGGLVVVVGSGDRDLLMELPADASHIMQALDTDEKKVIAARESIHNKGMYAKVSVNVFDGENLPYVDNLVNLIVIQDSQPGLSTREIERALAPRGVVMTASPLKESAGLTAAPCSLKGWSKYIRPVSESIDDWTHIYHGPDNNPVALDTVVGPPNSVQWAAHPKWQPYHEATPTIMASVSAGGRLFYVESLGELSQVTSDRQAPYALVARDAFNGVKLWQSALPNEWLSSRTGWMAVPVEVTRRLVAVGERVYLAGGKHLPVQVFDAADGKTIGSLDDSNGTEELLVCGDSLVLVKYREIRISKNAPVSDGELMVFDRNTFKRRWNRGIPLYKSMVAASGKRVFCYVNGELIACDLRNGKEHWRAGERAASDASPVRYLKQPPFMLINNKRIFVYDQKIMAFSAETGAVLWQNDKNGITRGFVTPADLFLADGVLFVNESTGLDPATGEEVRRIKSGYTGGHHHRCYPRKATSNYVMFSKRGVEFFDLKGTSEPSINDWVRAGCRLGFMPCNGLLYAPPHPCICYPRAMLHGYYALAFRKLTDDRNEPFPLEQGPAFGRIPNSKVQISNRNDWPTYRHDGRRSGATDAGLSANLKEVWRVRFSSTLTPPVYANERIIVSEKLTHTIHCMDGETGKILWQYTAGAQVDSPPTLYRGMVIFGSHDGWVYALRLADGKLAWRFRAAPADRQVVAFGKLSSVWRVHGSVLVRDGVVYAAAGRSSYLDGGIYLWGLDADTGKVIHQERLQGACGAPEDAVAHTGSYMPGAVSDIMTTDGADLFMRNIWMDGALNRKFGTKLMSRGYAFWRGVEQQGRRHLTSYAGFLDTSRMNRTSWIYDDHWPGHNFTLNVPKSGQLLSFDATHTYAIRYYSARHGYSPIYNARNGYQLIAHDNEAEIVGRTDWKGWGFKGTAEPEWATTIPLKANAMVATKKLLLVAGPQAEKNGKCIPGKAGLLCYSKENGRLLAQKPLPANPVFDGLIAVPSQLFIILDDGRVVSYGQERRRRSE